MIGMDSWTTVAVVEGDERRGEKRRGVVQVVEE